DGDTLQANVYAINPVIDQQSRTIHVRALLQQDPQKMIMPGTFAEVLVTTDFVEEALLVPSRAVVPEINDQTVYIYKNGKAVRRTIELGNRTVDKVQVLQGIVAGDTVITTGMLEVKEGMDVQIQLFN
ncbi:MAG: efflux RND transporter periplasmic adaptor subunit, partial [Cyclobacteriaceae bacterium]|nr:efflux RND transporter periplasmic adaptor subunit [Cyclobacteriaceae bacterium]